MRTLGKAMHPSTHLTFYCPNNLKPQVKPPFVPELESANDTHYFKLQMHDSDLHAFQFADGNE